MLRARRSAGAGRARRVAVAAALTAILGMAVTSAAQASVGTTTADGAYKTWRAAQRAAGFPLLQPGNTYRMRRTAPIQVFKCSFAGNVTRNVVSTDYASSAKRGLQLQEAHYRKPCGNLPGGKVVGHPRIHGVRATLIANCGEPGEPSCHARIIPLSLVWVHRGKSYGLACFGLRRRVLLGFARSMHSVRR